MERERKRGWEGVGSLAPILILISRDQQFIGHNIFQCLIHISMAPLGATQTLFPRKGEFWITLKPLEHHVVLTVLVPGAAQASPLVEKHPLASVSTSVGKSNGVHAHVSQGSKTFSCRGFYLTVEKQGVFLGKKNPTDFS